MAEDLFETLMRFHREVTIPDMHHLIRVPLEEKIESTRSQLRNEMLTGFDAVYKRFDRIETETVMMSARSNASSSASRLSNKR